ncbi:MAG TPA: xanthine dehydrogenase family protein [bacterium]|nr:xanthine dehydrogenase family protein [bacterium]
MRDIARLSDFPVADALYVGTVRSASSSGTIVSLSLPHLPRDYRSITADDIPGSRTMSVSGADVPILASGSVEYRGQPVALIAGPDRSKVMEAVAMSRVRLEETEPAYSFESFDSSRLVATADVETGDVDAAVAQAHHVVAGDYRFCPQDHYYPEPQGSAAAFDYDKLVILSSTQWPFHVRSSVAGALGVSPDEVIVRSTLLGPHLDGKLWYPSLIACHAALAARLCGRPALMLLSRVEDFLYTTKRAPMIASYRAGMDEAGRLVALDARIVVNMGAHAPLAAEIVQRIVASAVGGYSCPAVRVNAIAVRTNLPPMGAFAGLGTGPVAFAIERLAESCAGSIDADPSAWRSINAAGKGDLTLKAALKRSIPYDLIAGNLLVASDYPRKRSSFEVIRKRRPDPSSAPGFGIGLAFGHQAAAGTFGRIGSDAPSVEVTLSKDSRLLIKTSSVPSSRAALEIWKGSAALSLGLRHDAVRIETSCTDSVPDSGPETLSRNIGIVSHLLEAACEGLRTKRFREALPITIRKSQRARSRTAAPESPLEEASWAGAVVELQLDPVDGSPIIRGIWMTVRAGRILSMAEATRTIEHDAAVALGLSIGEYLDLSHGPADEDSIRRYRLPRYGETPPIHVEFLEDETSPKGIGELAYTLVPAAFANAMSQALDAPVNEMPYRASQPQEGVPR